MTSKRHVPWVILAIVIIAAGSGYYLRGRIGRGGPAPAESQDQQPDQGSSPTSAAGAAAGHYPVPEDDGDDGTRSGVTKGSATQLPALDASDQTLQAELIRLFGESPIAHLLNLKDIIRRFVVTVNNLPEQKPLSQDFSFLKPADDSFLTTQAGGALTIDPKNYSRYSSYLSLLQTVDTRKLVALYVHFYPLFQAAYRDLGSQSYFNDRAVQAIDNLLDTPEPTEPVQLNAKKTVYYKYADSGLEALTVGQKELIRIGPDNRRQVKEKLREIRARLTRLGQHD